MNSNLFLVHLDVYIALYSTALLHMEIPNHHQTEEKQLKCAALI
jgi:hypothetical protein